MKPWLALVLAAVAVFGGAVLKHEHNLRKSYSDAVHQLWGLVAQQEEKARDYLCEGIDGFACYAVMEEFRRDGLRAAVDKRAEVLQDPFIYDQQ